MQQKLSKVMKILETMSVSVAAHRLAQMGYHKEAKKLLMEMD